jgi:hypothetical protein
VETTFNYSLRPLVVSHHRHKQSSCHHHKDRKESNRHNRPFETHNSVGDIVIAIKCESSHRVVGLLSKLTMILMSFSYAFPFRTKWCNLLIYILYREIKSRYSLDPSFTPRCLQLKILLSILIPKYLQYVQTYKGFEYIMSSQSNPIITY